MSLLFLEEYHYTNLFGEVTQIEREIKSVHEKARKTVKQVPDANETNHFMMDKKDIIYNVDIFRATLKLLVETRKQPFIPPSDFDYIWPFLKILGYQGSLEIVSTFSIKNLAQPWQTMFKILGYQGSLEIVSTFFIKNLAQPWQTMFKVFNICLTSLMTGHDQTMINIMQIFHAVVNKVHIDYASLLWPDFLHYVMQNNNSIQYPRLTKLIIVDLIEKYESIPKRLKEEYNTIKDDTSLVNMYTTWQVMVRGMQITNDLLTNAIKDTQVYKDYVEEDVEKLVEREDESDGDEFIDIVLLSDEDSNDKIEP
nr:hypothetical protein [Tanacetum cinerariifolium]